MLKILLLLLFTVNLSAQEDNSVLIDNSVLPAKVNTDYKAQIEKLKPKLVDKNMNTMGQQWTGYIKSAEGNVYIKRQDNKGNLKITFPASAKDLLAITDVVDVGKGGRAEIRFRDKETINLGTSTTLRLDDNDSWTLLLGSIRVRTVRSALTKEVSLYAPNLAVFTSDKADFVVRYSGRVKATTVAAFVGKLNISGIRDSKDLKGFDKNIVAGESLEVITTHGKGKEDYLATEPEKLTMDSKKDILESFYNDPSRVDSWEYTRPSSSFFRFAPSFEYSKFREETTTRYIGASIGYVPLIFFGSRVYMEPYFYLSIAKPFDRLFFRTGASLQVNPFYGLYLGMGGGVFWIRKEASKYGADFTTYLGYTFPEKFISCIDGVRFSYFASKASEMHLRAYLFSVIFNFGRGRELY